MSEARAQLVPERTCGDCVACCRALTVDAAELQKPAGVLCTHCAPGRGCTIYASRPPACRGWYCAWRRMDQLSARWRPDRSGLLIELHANNLPDAFSGKSGLKVTVLTTPQKTLDRRAAALLGGFVRQQIPVYLATMPKPGRASGKALLNQFAADLASGNERQVIRALRRCYDIAASVRTDRVRMVHGSV